MTHRLPPSAIEALARGNKIEAIKITRQHTGLGLKESKELVDRHEDGHAEGQGRAAAPAAARHAPGTPARHPGLAPGEVPRSRLSVGLLVTVGALVAALLVYLFRG